MPKRWFLVLPLILFAVLLFHNWIISTTIQYSFLNKLEKIFDGEAYYNHIEKSASGLLISELEIYKGDERVFKCSELEISYDITWLKPEIHLRIEALKPVIDLSKAKLNAISESSQPFLKVTLGGEIKEGLLITDGIETPFSVTTTTEKAITVGESVFKKSGNDWDLTLNSLELKPLSFLAESLGINKNIHFQGVANGNLKIYLEKDKSPTTEGHVSIDKFKADLGKHNSEINHVEFDLERGEALASSLPVLKGVISFNGGRIATWQHNSPFELKDVDGHIRLLKDDEIQIIFNGLEAIETNHKVIAGEFKADLNRLEKISVEGIFKAKSGAHGESELKLKITDVGAPYSLSELHLKNFGLFEYALFDKIAKRVLKAFPSIDFQGGLIDGSFKVAIHNSEPSDISADNLSIRNLKVYFPEWDVSAYAQNVSGLFNLNLNEVNARETVEGELLVVNGDLKFHSLAQELSHFSEIQTKLKVVDGHLEKSVASVTLAGLKGSAEIDWLVPEELIKIKLEGTGSDLAKMMPPRFSKGIMRHLSKERLVVEARLSEEIQALRLKGELYAFDPFNALKQKLEFGFDLKKGDTPLKTKEEEAFFSQVAPKLLQETLPASVLGTGLAMSHILQGDEAIEGLLITNGWLQANEINLERYISPFLFPKDDLILSGTGSINAQFDLKGMKISYQAKNLALENPVLLIKMPSTVEKGTHWVDFYSKSHAGQLKVQDADYFDKSKGLYISNMEGSLNFFDKMLYLDPMKAEAGDLKFLGDLTIDYSDPGEGVFDLAIRAHSLQGPYSQAAALLKKIDPNLFLTEVPLEAALHLDDPGAILKFHFIPHEYEWDAKVSGYLTDGELDFNPHALKGKDIGLHFSYDREKKTLMFDDLNGLLLFGEPNHEEKYTFESERFGFEDFENLKGFFNFSLNDLKGEVGKLQGSIFKEGLETHIVFEEPVCHFGQLGCTAMKLKLDELKKVNQFKFESQFRLSSLVYELSRFSKTGLFFIPPALFQKLADFNSSSGEVLLKLEYEGDFSHLTFSITGEDLVLDTRTFKEVKIEGEKKGNLWTINDAKIDDINISLDAQNLEEKWKINHLGIRKGDLLLAGLKGEWNENDPRIEADIALFELDLNHLDEVADSEILTKQYQPNGIFKGTGKVIWDNDSLRLKIRGKLNDLQLKDIHFDNKELFEVEWIPKQEWRIQNLKLEPHSRDNISDRAAITVERARLDSNTNELDLFPLRFSVDSIAMPWFVKFVKEWADIKGSPAFDKGLSEIKQSGRFEGSLVMTQKEGERTLNFHLADGNYFFDGQSYDLKGPQVEITPEEIRSVTQLVKGKALLWVIMRTVAPDYDRGVVVIADGTYQEQEPITLKWNTEPGFLVVEEIKGSAQGLTFQLKEAGSTPDFLLLEGDIGFDGRLAKELMKPELASKMEAFEIGKGFGLKGLFALARQGENYAFEGDLYGLGVELKGYRFDQLVANVKADEKTHVIRNLSIVDAAGEIFVPEIRVDLTGPGSLSIPKVEVNELRPSHLYEVGKGRPAETKPFLIRQLTVSDVYGAPLSVEALSGKGSFHFANPVKKNLHNTIFKIPAEILSRIGIDLIALTPVTGHVFFDISDGQVHLLKFKDVYSDGKLSKFYLSSDYPSTIDFDGQLNMHVKMKQYTLLFKLAELLTFHIEGTLAKPTYSLKKHGKEEISFNEIEN